MERHCTPMYRLRVVKAFRSSLEEFDERRSIASTHSVQSMRGGFWGGGRHTTTAASPDPSSRHPMAAISHRQSPQPYPYYHHQQPRTPSPQPHIVVENGNVGASGSGSQSQKSAEATTTTTSNGKTEKVPLVQQWSPGTNSSYTQTQRSINKSMSLDAPVSVAHV
uniref:Uncharacterized protein n=1 Tax=Caenorhabditis japonica TaxID=281687 RepID=A0A8R1I7S6_CAEJA